MSATEIIGILLGFVAFVLIARRFAGAKKPAKGLPQKDSPNWEEPIFPSDDPSGTKE